MQVKKVKYHTGDQFAIARSYCNLLYAASDLRPIHCFSHTCYRNNFLTH